MGSYEAQDLLARIDEHTALILAGFGLAMVFWIGLLSAMLLELVFFAQAIIYGREELLPSWSTAAFAALIACGALGTIVAWEYLREVITDPLYQVGPPLTMLAYPIAGAAMVIRRGSAAGQTVRMWVCFAGMAICWWTTTALFFVEPPFRSWPYLAVGVITVAGCAGMAVAVRRLRATEAGQEPASGNGAAAARQPAGIAA